MEQQGKVEFSNAFSTARSQTPLDGRVLLILAATDHKGSNEKEPSEQISDALDTQQIFGMRRKTGSLAMRACSAIRSSR
jgi:hypothetical protein